MRGSQAAQDTLPALIPFSKEAQPMTRAFSALGLFRRGFIVETRSLEMCDVDPRPRRHPVPLELPLCRCTPRKLGPRTQAGPRETPRPLPSRRTRSPRGPSFQSPAEVTLAP